MTRERSHTEGWEGVGGYKKTCHFEGGSGGGEGQAEVAVNGNESLLS